METINVCAKPGCGKESKLRCPDCIKRKIKDESYFCGKDCFKGYWSEHKKIHNECIILIKLDGPIEDGYIYTGSLRPWRKTPKRLVPDNIQKPDYADDPNGVSKFEEKERNSKYIPVYNNEEIEGIRQSCKLARYILDEAHKLVKPGITTDEIDQLVHELTIKNEAYPSPLNYYEFPKSVCTSVNEVICHGIPDLRPLENGDIVNVDISIYYKGYHSDLNETYLVGEVDNESKHLVQSAYNGLMKAVDICKPGTLYKEIGNVISKYIEAEGLSVVKTYCGHGVGKLFHCNPNVPHYKNNKAVGSMKPGHIFTIEPMINKGSWKDVTWLDNWTAVTQDGKRSAQFEHTILITETGYEVLTARIDSSPLLEIFNN